MKIIVTGSLGNISRPLATQLVQQGHTVTVVSSDPARQKDIEALGATAAIGSMEDAAFLTTTFTGADAAYCMVPPAHASEPDRVAYYRRIAGNYAQAIQRAGVPRIVHLSSIGAHLAKGTGIIVGAYEAERILNVVPGIALTHLRPAYFYYNLYNFIGMIKGVGRIAANYGADDNIVLVSPLDIADVAAGALVARPATSPVIRYIASDICSGHDIAAALGAAIGQPGLQWALITDEQMQSGMEANGLPASLAATLTEMYACLHSGALSEDYYRHQPETMGKVKLADFAKDFAVIYQQA